MSAVRMRARADLRTRRLSTVVLVLLTGLVGAIAMSALAGARRTDDAYPRYRVETRQPAAIVGSGQPWGAPIDLEEVARLPQVESWVPARLDIGAATTPDGRIVFSADSGANLIAVDPADVGPVRILSGRLPSAPGEAAVSWTTLDGVQPSVGDEIDMHVFDADAPPEVMFADPTPPEAFLPPLRLHVVGVVISAEGLNGSDASIYVTPDTTRKLEGHPTGLDVGLYHLNNDLADLPAFEAGLSAMSADAFYFDGATEASFAAQSTHLTAIVLRLFGWLVAFAGGLVVVQALVRRTSYSATDNPTLRALGMTRGQVARSSMVGPAIVGVVGAALAVGLAIVASAFLPFGFARFIEADHGISVDLAVLGAGAALIIVAILVAAAVPAWRLAGASGGSLGTTEFAHDPRPSRVAEAFARAGMPPPATAGARLALDPGHGRTAVPVRGSLVGLSLAVATMVGAFGFAASMANFVAHPELRGFTFTFAAGNPFAGTAVADHLIPALHDDEGFTALTTGNFQRSVIVDAPTAQAIVAVWGLQADRGPLIHPGLLEGRWPERDDEIALGRETLRALGAKVGDTVSVSGGGQSVPMRIVGVPVLPDFGFGPGLGVGGGITYDQLKAFFPTSDLNLALGTLTPGVDRQAMAARLKHPLKSVDESFRDSTTAHLGDASTAVTRARSFPLVLSALFALAALAALVHLLVTSVRRRRRDLAILQTVGFRPRQLLATVAWQAAILTSVALVIGVPAGIVLGRFGWALFADRLGVFPDSVVAWVPALLAIPVTLLIAVVVAIVPGLIARRTRPAVVLRAE